MTRLRIVAVGGPAQVQDLGRPGRMHEGIPPGGALVPELLEAANRAVGNPLDAAGIEHAGSLLVGSDVALIAATSDAMLTLAPGAPTRIALAPDLRVGYLAVTGGLAVPELLGGRGTLAAAGIGLLLRAGDELDVGPSEGSSPAHSRAPRWADRPLRVVPGPDPGDLARLFGSTFTISRFGDRVGVRLSGRPIAAPRPSRASAPMTRGAIQATPSGELVVLGPDHPTTGGYPVIGVIASADVGPFFARPIGSVVQFRMQALP